MIDISCIPLKTANCVYDKRERLFRARALHGKIKLKEHSQRQKIYDMSCYHDLHGDMECTQNAGMKTYHDTASLYHNGCTQPNAVSTCSLGASRSPDVYYSSTGVSKPSAWTCILLNSSDGCSRFESLRAASASAF